MFLYLKYSLKALVLRPLSPVMLSMTSFQGLEAPISSISNSMRPARLLP